MYEKAFIRNVEEQEEDNFVSCLKKKSILILFPLTNKKAIANYLFWDNQFASETLISLIGVSSTYHKIAFQRKWRCGF